MKPATVWVLARAGEPGMQLLSPPPAGVTFVTGAAAEAFAGAPPPDVLFVCGHGPRVLAPVLERAPAVRWVHSRYAGVEGVLFPALVESPAILTNARGVFSRSLAEFVVAGLLYFAKDLRRMTRNQAAGRWEPFDVEELAGRTLAIVGYGDIGRAIAERVRPFGMRVIAVRRRSAQVENDGLVHEVATVTELREVLARADDVAVALPLTSDTRRLIGETALRALKPTSVFVNVGRGAVVDEPALVRALEERRLKGAALDVFETEPLPVEHAFWRLDNVLLSPHCADHTVSWLDDATRCFLQNLERFRRGEPLLNIVDKRAGY